MNCKLLIKFHSGPDVMCDSVEFSDFEGITTVSMIWDKPNSTPRQVFLSSIKSIQAFEQI